MHFFFSEVTKFFRVQVRIIARAGASARAKLFVRLGTSLLFQDKSNGNSLLHHGIFFFLSRELSYIHSERFLIIFFMLCSYFQYNECKKKSRNSRGKKRAMETHFYTMDFFFFLSRELSYIHSERFLIIFFYAVLVFPE